MNTTTTRRQFLNLAMGAGASALVARTSPGALSPYIGDDDRALTGKGMNALLFFDDWLLDRRDGLDRRWHQPTFVKQVFSEFYPGFLGYGGYMSVFRDRRLGRYVMYAAVFPPQADPSTFVIRLESDDPWNWPNPRYTTGVQPAWKGFENVVVDQTGERFWPYCVQPLAGTPLQDRGYVTSLAYVTPGFEDFIRRSSAGRGGAGLVPPRGLELRSVLAFSDDGLRFQVDRSHPWRHVGADQSGNFLWSEALGKFLIFTRRVSTDRRIVYSTTADFRQFSPLLTSMQPDHLDPIGTEFYDLPARPYEDLYLGLLHVQSTDPQERVREKFSGRMQTELVHSYNGVHWVRGPRADPFLSVRDYGEEGGGTVYGMELLRTPDHRLLIFAEGSYGEHGAYPAMQAAGMDTTGYISPLLYELRLDGFCSLRTRSRDGLLETKTLVPQAAGLSLNLRTARHTSVRVQLLDGVSLAPLPGYTFADAIEIRGDHLFAPVRWKGRNDLAEWVGRPVRLQIEMHEAELFAIRLAFQAYYAGNGMPPLASLA